MPNMRSLSSLLYLRSLPLPTFSVPPRPQYTITFFRLSSCSAAFFPNSGSLSARALSSLDPLFDISQEMSEVPHSRKCM